MIDQEEARLREVIKASDDAGGADYALELDHLCELGVFRLFEASQCVTQMQQDLKERFESCEISYERRQLEEAVLAYGRAGLRRAIVDFGRKLPEQS